VLGGAYKRDVNDVRESPALDIMQLLQNKGAQVVYHDPFVPSVRLEDEHTMQNEPYSAALLEYADCVVIVTDHSTFDYQQIADHSRLIVDTRHVVHPRKGRARVVTL
jgi:UDP-N-acetyl-D-glucosamine dehydrogenase